MSSSSSLQRSSASPLPSWLSFAAGMFVATVGWWWITNSGKNEDGESTTRNNNNAERMRDNKESNDDEIWDDPNLDLRMLRKAEGAIQKRTSQITVVIERCTNDHNYSAILRTTEALGVQNVWIILGAAAADEVQQQKQHHVSFADNENENDNENLQQRHHTTMKGQRVQLSVTEQHVKRQHHLYAQRALEWLTLKEFTTTFDCIKELRQTGHEIWATDLSQQAKCLSWDRIPSHYIHYDDMDDIPHLPPKLAIVFGTEAVGCTQEMLESADLRVYLPLRGFADSLNLSVATALVLHHLFLLDPRVEGNMTEQERHELRRTWFPKLATQRLLTSRQKKQRAKLQAKLHQISRIQEKQDNENDNVPLQSGELELLQRRDDIQRELNQLERDVRTKAEAVVEEFIRHPPSPLTDMRRADQHRTCFVGRNTKSKYQGIWDNMPATTGYRTQDGYSSSQFFRTKLKEQQDIEEENDKDTTN